MLYLVKIFYKKKMSRIGKQFIILPNQYDPDTYINEFSLSEFAKYLKNQLSIVDFIFEESYKSIANFLKSFLAKGKSP